VEIRVDRLALHGLPPGQRRAVEEAIVRELGQIGREGGISSSSSSDIASRVSQAVQRKPER
jgi:hypothetical protein